MSIKNDFYNEVKGLAEDLQTAKEKYDAAVKALSLNDEENPTTEELSELELTYADEVAQYKGAHTHALRKHLQNLMESVDACLSRAPSEEVYRLLQVLDAAGHITAQTKAAVFKKISMCPLAVDAFFKILHEKGHSAQSAFPGCTVDTIDEICASIRKSLVNLERDTEQALSNLDLSDPDTCFQQLAGIGDDMSKQFFALIEA